MVATSTSGQNQTSNEEKAKNILSVNASEPVTTIQIRLADGSRLAATLNHNHTVSNVKDYIKTYPFNSKFSLTNSLLLNFFQISALFLIILR